MSIVTPIPLKESGIEETIGVLVRSFAADPGLLFVLPNADDRERLGPPLARAVIRYAITCGSPLVLPDPVRGVALWFPPDAPGLAGDDLAMTGIARVPEQIGTDAWGRFKRMMDHLDTLHAHYAPEPHWYLAMIGVDPPFQGQGLGKALMQPVLTQADREGVACYLETPNHGNVPFYEKRGFRVMAEVDIADSEVHLWLMRREAVL